MEEKNEYIKQYIDKMSEYLIKNGINISNEQVEHVFSNFKNSEMSIEEIIDEINKLVDNYIENVSEKKEIKRLEYLKILYNGITLNNQDIDLLLIASASTQEELEQALSQITNINIPPKEEKLSDEELFHLKKEVYQKYIDTLTSKNEFFENDRIKTQRKIEHLFTSGILSKEEINKINEIIELSNSIDEIKEEIGKEFEKTKVNKIHKTLREFSPIEKSGIKSMSMEASENLLNEIKTKYNSITVDEEVKYGNIVLGDGTFEYKHLQKSLDFAKKYNKKVRLNTILFYMDCPESLYNLEKTDENKKLVKRKLGNYVDSTTNFIRNNGYGDTVRSIDVFNELLNRFALEGDNPYLYRGDIKQVANESNEVDDNIKSGWLKHLTIDDLCDVVAIARKNLPETDFMYNDDNLTDPKKMEATVKIIEEIRKNEKRLGVKLIDSIGTQMHIDNNVSKEEIRQMFIGLSQFGLPIEITEFDIAMTSGIDNLTEEQIEALRTKKINEVYDVVDELKNQVNINGFTIWSKTDKQNFRVSLENEKRIKNGLEPIETLHGGYYTDDMKSKTLKKENFQSFNYHTHTKRCGHAGTSSDQEYVDSARKAGIKQLGFSDHVPVTNLEIQDNEHNMHITDVDEYVSSIKELQEKNPDMTIISGFEVEYDPMKAQFLCDLREKVDYMIIGQHFLGNGINKGNNPEYPLQYAERVCKAMESGIFDVVAHPDIFMKSINTCDSEEKKALFMKKAEQASVLICEKAKELEIPLEINFGGLEKSNGEVDYPNSIFWKVAAEKNCLVLYGVDAHSPNQFEMAKSNKEKVDKIITHQKLNFVDKDYNPVEARKKNGKLNELYKNTQENSLTYETNLISGLISNMVDKIPVDDFESNKETISEIVGDYLKKIEENAGKANEIAKEKLSSEKNELINNNVSQQEKDFKLDRIEKTIEHVNDTDKNQKAAFNRAQDTVKKAIEMGCKNKEEFKRNVTLITEQKTTKNGNIKLKIDNAIQQNKNQTNTINSDNSNMKQNNGPTLVKKENSTTSSSGNKGFTNSLTLFITFVFAILIGIIYIIYKMHYK